ncbi:YjcQ family protein [Peptococcus simiae]|uniref:YjcQ family protein n=1 Tax=Peptococcus simiae TaxID=1643805 RepID=UPI00398166C3
MNNFTIIYRILKTLNTALDCPEPDMTRISAEQLGISPIKRDNILRLMQEEGLIRGLGITGYFDGVHYVDDSQVHITFAGMQYLQENSMMKKAANLAKGIVDTIL